MADETAENKVEFGLKNAHYAVVTDTGEKLEYGEWKALPGATEISIDPEGGSEPFYADDTKYYTAVSNQGYSGKLTLARIPESFNQDVFGETIDSNTGLQVDNTSANPKQIALGFEFDGDRNQTRHILFNVTATRPSIGSSTKSDKVEPGTSELSFTAAPDPYTSSSHGKVTKDKPAYATFFESVVVPGMEVAPSEG